MSRLLLVVVFQIQAGLAEMNGCIGPLLPGGIFFPAHTCSKPNLLQGGASGQTVGFTMGYHVPPYCPPDQPFLPISQQPKQKQVECESGTAKDNPTILSDQTPLPVPFSW